MISHIRLSHFSCRGADDTDSDGDGGVESKLRGSGQMEFSQKGIPHGILHFPEQLKWAGHVYMYDTCAPEASHKVFIKQVMDRVKKESELATSSSMIHWIFRVDTWSKIIKMVQRRYVDREVRRQRPPPKHTLRIMCDNASKLLRPHSDVGNRMWGDTFSPLNIGGENLMSPDARVSYNEFGTLVSSFTGWDREYVMSLLHVTLYCTARVQHPSGATRTYWGTESRYPYGDGKRRDFVEVDLGGGKSGVAQLTSFVHMHVLPVGARKSQSKAVLIRWLSVSSLSQDRDDYDRSLCSYPLSSNHCLWEWSDAGRNRACFSVPGFNRTIQRQQMWPHVSPATLRSAIDSEKRARYDIISYNSIIRHANIAVDPSTGHMLQTLQII